jgi:hypothetical protein
LLAAGDSWPLLAHHPHYRFFFIVNTREQRLTRQDTLAVHSSQAALSLVDAL